MNFSNPNFTLEEVFDRINCIVCLCKKDFTIVGANLGYSKLYGCQPSELIGKKPMDYFPDFRKSVFYECCYETIKTGNTISRVGYSIPLKGWYAVRTSKYDEEHSILIGYEISKDLNYSGFAPIHDSLTSLYNRHKLEDDMRLNLSKQVSFGLVIIDILKLKKFNEVYGVLPSDMLLMEIAGKIRLKLYKSGSIEVYRISADKFAIIIKDTRKKCLEIINEVSDIFNEPFKMSNDKVKVNVSIGFNYIENINLNTNKESFSFIEETENAVEVAKNKKTLYVECNNGTSKVNKKDLIKEIKQAFANKEFTIFYQPQFDCIKNRICGAEALIRWNHKSKGLIPPHNFLPLIEDFELNEELDKFVFEQGAKDSVYFQEAGFNLPISLNISPSSLSNDRIIDFFDEQSKKYFVDNHLLTVEITESSLIESIEHSKKIISNFSAKGLKIAIDDFGAGYSSFGYLVRYPTDYLKIDRQFISDIHNKKNLRQIVPNLIKMAHSLGMLVVAEGVEVQEEADILRKFGCDIIQGFFYGKPIPKEQFLARLKREGMSNFKSDFI